MKIQRMKVSEGRKGKVRKILKTILEILLMNYSFKNLEMLYFKYFLLAEVFQSYLHVVESKI